MRRNLFGTITLHTLGLALLVYTASRTVDFLTLTLPLEQQTLAFIGLAAFDGGLLGWLIYHLTAARGPAQRAISFAMILVSLAGIVIAFAGDTIYRAGERGTLAAASPTLILTVVLATTAIIGANIVALVALHLTDPAARRRQAEQDAADTIDEETTAQIAAQSATLAAALAPARAAAWLADARSRYTPAAPAEIAEPAAPILKVTNNGTAPKSKHRTTE